jgi:hypothetical protein
VRVVIALHEALEGLGFLERLEILTLKVLNQGDFIGIALGDDGVDLGLAE